MTEPKWAVEFRNGQKYERSLLATRLLELEGRTVGTRLIEELLGEQALMDAIEERDALREQEVLLIS